MSAGAPRFQVVSMIELTIIGSVRVNDVPRVEKLLSDYAAQLMDALAASDGPMDMPHALVQKVRPASQEEIQHLFPRKVHFSETPPPFMSGAVHQICTTAHVSKRNLTTNAPDVTCKLCRKLLVERGIIQS